MQRYYISGPITADTTDQVKANLAKFNEAEDAIRKRHGDGSIFNPARLEIPGGTWPLYMARDTKWITENKPTIILLPGWETSRGANLEIFLGLLCGGAVIPIETFLHD